MLKKQKGEMFKPAYMPPLSTDADSEADHA
jgi:hypothetical protein